MGIDHVTVTMNAVDPHVAEGIYAWIFWDHAWRTGLEAARILIERQLQGIEMLTAAGILVKINSVMIPGVNDDHLDAVNAAVKERGVFPHNVMPLISGSVARHPLRPHRPARPHARRAQGAARPATRRPADEALPAVPRRRRRPAGRGPGRQFGLESLPENPEIDPAKAPPTAPSSKERSDRRREAAEARAAIRRWAPPEPKAARGPAQRGGRVNQHRPRPAVPDLRGERNGACFAGHRRRPLLLRRRRRGRASMRPCRRSTASAPSSPPRSAAACASACTRPASP
ncbi:MAG: radical SAM protein [Rhodospirillales bacterium]